MCSMASTVQLSEEAYKTLTALKRKGESYSDVVLRLASERKDPRRLLELSGWPDDLDVRALRDASREADLAKLRRHGAAGGDGERSGEREGDDA